MKRLNLKWTALLIRERRENMGLPRYKVARAMGCSSQFYCRIEKGAVHLPKKSIKKLMRFLNISDYTMFSAMTQDYEDEVRKLLGVK